MVTKSVSTYTDAEYDYFGRSGQLQHRQQCGGVSYTINDVRNLSWTRSWYRTPLGEVYSTLMDYCMYEQAPVPFSLSPFDASVQNCHPSHHEHGVMA
jgi:hypothetical protein